MTVSHTSIEDIYHRLMSSRMSLTMTPLAKRKAALKALFDTITKHEDKIFLALKEDLGRASFESYITEVALIKNEIKLALKSLNRWAKPQHVKTPLVFQPACSFIDPMPKGLVLIIAPWNYPLQLALLPLISAIAAGNTAIIKPSELAPSSAKAIELIVKESLDPDCFRVILGDKDVANDLLNLRFDHIFFTGGAHVGRIVLEKASRFLTPTTLELGGKCPVIIDKNVNLELATKRIWWAKCLNAGQTCIAPDYVLIDKDLRQEFIALSKNYLSQTYKHPSPSYSQIINDSHMKRLIALLEDQDVVYGGQYNMANRYFEPTIINNVSESSLVMKDEIFGPLLPILTVNTSDEAIDFINNRPDPLAIYIFSNDKGVQEQVRTKTRSGGLCINECINHAGILSLPFGGIGPSGMGNYHGKFGFLTFSHLRAVHKRATILDNPIKYPPYSDQKLTFARLVMK